MTRDTESFSKYGRPFQEGLVQIILDDRAFADQIGEVLDIEFLELKHLQLFLRKLYGYKEKYRSHPSRKMMATMLRADISNEPEALQQQVRDYYAKVLASPALLEEEEYIREASLDFCRKQKLKEAMIKSVKLLKNSSFDEISEVINNALKLGSENNFGHEYIKDFEDRFVIKARNPVSTGWPLMDGITNGGLGKSELGVVLAPTGAGKSMVLVHLGAAAVKAGKTVVHYTLELQDTVVATRYDSCITGIPLNSVHQFKDEVYKKIKDIKGSLIVKEYPTKTASTNSIRAHLERLRQRSIYPDMIILDYADLLRPIKVEKEKRNELESIYENLRAMSQSYECPIWTASQTNRSGLSVEVVTMEEISEAYSKCFVADFIFSLSRSKEDKIGNTGRFHIAKNRNGPDGRTLPIFMDTRNVRIEAFNSKDHRDDELKKRKKNIGKTTAEKYQMHLKEKKNGIHQVTG